MGANQPGGLRSAVLKGAAWSVATRWAIRGLGLVSTIVLARLLTPADFGLVAMAMLVVAFVEAWLSFGLETALIQNQSATREHYDTAWTLRIIQSIVVAILVAAAAPFAADYFKEPRVVPVIWAICLGLVVIGFSNVGVVAFRKELELHKEFRLQLAGKLLGFFIGIGAAIWLRNYWALVIGTVAGMAILCVLSYLMHPYRPRFSLTRVRELWSFSQWMLVRSIGHFAEMRADEVIVGGLGSTRQMGLYNVAAELGRLPGSELAGPLNQALVPGFAKLQHDPHRVATAYLNALGALGTATLPAAIGLALVANELVPLLMGEQWVDAAPLLVLLAISNAVRTGDSLATSFVLGTGRPRMGAAFSWLNAILLVGIAVPLVGDRGPEGVAIGKVIGGVILTAFIWVGISRISEVTLKSIVARLWRPVLASGLMAIAVASIAPLGHGLLADLVLKIVVGVVSYCVGLLAIWRLVGCPDGAERFFLSHVSQRLRR
jgi:O-antigen/teichoic acid export membrane protein